MTMIKVEDVIVELGFVAMTRVSRKEGKDPFRRKRQKNVLDL